MKKRLKKRTWLFTLKEIILFAMRIVLPAAVVALAIIAVLPWILVKLLAFSISDLSPAWYYASISLLTVLLMALIWWALQVIPKKQARALQKPESSVLIGERKIIAEDFTATPQSAVKPTELFSIENEARKTLSQIIGGFIVIVSLILTGANLAITSRLTQEGQITDRFTKAITQLGDEKLEVRLGGIYALERIARDSEKDHWTIMEVLTAYVREHISIRKVDNEIKLSSNKMAGDTEQKDTEQKDKAKLPTDIRAILTVLGRRIISEEREKGRLDLEEIDLSQASLTKANLERANLSGADLSGTILLETNLSRAFLYDTNLRGAILLMANLTGANLTGANLTGANLYSADLERADLIRADLSGADLSGADLERADLSGAELSEVKNLTWEQVSQTTIDDQTKLPDEIENRHKDELRAMREKTKKEREGK